MAAGDKKQPMYGAESTISDQIADIANNASGTVIATAVNSIIAALENYGILKKNS